MKEKWTAPDDTRDCLVLYDTHSSSGFIPFIIIVTWRSLPDGCHGGSKGLVDGPFKLLDDDTGSTDHIYAYSLAVEQVYESSLSYNAMTLIIHVAT